jgi:magnesium chelatase family protein
MTSTTREGLQSVAIKTATVKGGTVKIIQMRLSLVPSMQHRFEMSYADVGTAISRDRYTRVRSAMDTSGFPFPTGFIGAVVQGDDAETHDEPTHDLAVAIGLLTLQGVVPQEAVNDILAIGELSLSGHVYHCRGILALAAEAACLPLRPILLVPAPGIEEARIVDRTHSVEIAHLGEIEAILGGTPFRPSATDGTDLADVKGLRHASRALTIAAAGGHHVLMVGPPGAGGTMLARRLPDLLPLLSREEAIEVTAVHSLAGRLSAGASYVRTRPFRAPHHTVSLLGMMGGDRKVLGGEISLAHRGVLFLDDATEFSRGVLEGVGVALSKLRPVHEPFGLLHATVLCVASVRPCPCGWRGSQAHTCLCSEDAVRQQWRRLTPLMGLVDLRVDLTAVGTDDELGGDASESSPAVRARVIAARVRQVHRERRLSDCLRTNGLLDASQLRPFCSAEAIELAGGDNRISLAILRVARSIADLADAEKVQVMHVQEAKRYQPSWP